MFANEFPQRKDPQMPRSRSHTGTSAHRALQRASPQHAEFSDRQTGGTVGWKQMFAGGEGEHSTFPSHSVGLYLEDILVTPSLLSDPIYLEVLCLVSKVACLLCKHLFNAVSSGLEGRSIRNPRTAP